MILRTLAKQSIGLLIGATLAWVATATATQVAARWNPAPPAQAAPVVVAAAPVAPVLHYQGRLLDPTTGQPKPDGNYTMSFRLYGAAAGGSALWTESKSVAVSKGLFTTLLGDTTALDLAQFDGRELYLGVSVGADPEAAPRQRLAFVAYSLYAANADKLDGQEAADFAPVSHAHDGAAITSGVVAEPFIDPAIARDAEIMPAVLGADGSGSGVDADLLDGQDSTAFAAASHSHAQFGMLPIAFAHINSNGTVASGTPNVSSVWNASLQRYEITIAGESYFYTAYTTVVTSICDSAFTRTSSVSNNLLVFIQSNNTPIQCNFQFVTFKP